VTDAASSHMRATMGAQPDELRRLLADDRAVQVVAERIANSRRIVLAGTGTSWHAANQGAWFLRRAGLDARAAQAIDLVLEREPFGPGDVLVALTHTGAKRYTPRLIADVRAAGAHVVVVSGRDVEGADLETVARERSAAYTASHTAALVRLAQLATALGASLGDLEAVPDAVQSTLAARHAVEPPARLLQFIGGGVNEWTAAEGALKIRETAYVAACGLGVEQFLHGPSVALRPEDALVCVDGGGTWSERIDEVAGAAEAAGTAVLRIREHELGEALSVFPLTAAVQSIALQAAETLGTNPDSFGRDIAGREPWQQVKL
jgi:glutamine---fructose-6-phosphate transaminase (isomerizing)